jgi:hypothetical protein
MLFCHVFDDYFLQSGCLANLKQKKWWKENPDPVARWAKYRNDYIMALFMHAASWTFMVMLPVAMYHDFNVGGMFVLNYIINVLVHAFVDDEKANRHSSNLIQDQLFHIWQIICIFVSLVVFA